MDSQLASGRMWLVFPSLDPLLPSNDSIPTPEIRYPPSTSARGWLRATPSKIRHSVGDGLRYNKRRVARNDGIMVSSATVEQKPVQRRKPSAPVSSRSNLPECAVAGARAE